MTNEPPPVVLLAEPPDERAPVPPGWTGHPGLRLPSSPWDLAGRRLACVASVVDDESAGRAVEALARGVGLVVHVALDGAAKHRFLDDLHHLACPTTYVLGVPALGIDQIRLLDALADGDTVTAAAARLHLSRRTANRLLSAARAELGTETTAEAVKAWVSRRPRA